jgi:hypothetical protein
MKSSISRRLPGSSLRGSEPRRGCRIKMRWPYAYLGTTVGPGPPMSKHRWMFVPTLRVVVASLRARPHIGVWALGACTSPVCSPGPLSWRRDSNSPLSVENAIDPL